jgi:hypothetical protein
VSAANGVFARKTKIVSAFLQHKLSDLHLQPVPRCFIIEVMNAMTEWYKKNQGRADIGIFVGGFFFDVATLSRPDDWLMLLQQVLYISMLTFLLYRMDAERPFTSQLGQKIWQFRNLIFHFFLGSLLSLYTLFFFKSASLWNSFAFLFLLVAVLIINELPQFQKRGHLLKWVLINLMLICFCNLAVPIFTNRLGVLVFILSLIVAVVLHALLYKQGIKKLKPEAHRNWLKATVGVYATWILLYLFNVIPPIPLALEKSGIYHLIEKQAGAYTLSYERAAWKFWESGAQTFVKRPNDEVYFFARVFAPKGFQDQIFTVWKFKDPRQGWVQSDKIPISLLGGREEGFRIYSKKKNLQNGNWRVEVQTSDSREIGRLYFEVQESLELRIEPFNTELE